MIKPMHPFAVFLLDLWAWVKSLLCIIRRRHKDEIVIGALAKPGFRGVAMHGCRFCSTMYLKEDAARRFGGSRPS